MPFFLVLTQAAAPAPIVSPDTAVSVTVLVLLLGLAATVGGALVRIARGEADQKETRTKLETLEAKQSTTATEVAVLTSTLGRIEASQARIEAQLQTGRRQSA